MINFTDEEINELRKELNSKIEQQGGIELKDESIINEMEGLYIEDGKIYYKK